jgi:hypothetical protein
MKDLRLRHLCVSGALALLGGCAGYNLQIGSSGFGEFSQVYSVPASSLTPWAERTSSLPLPPPPIDGGPGSSTLPATRAALPPERPPAPSSSR